MYKLSRRPGVEHVEETDEMKTLWLGYWSTFSLVNQFTSKIFSVQVRLFLPARQLNFTAKYEMNKSCAFKIFITLLYLLLVISFFIFATARTEKIKCDVNSPCVRLCNATNEVMDFIELTDPTTNITIECHILGGEPCEKLKLLETDQWTFSSVSACESADLSPTLQHELFYFHAERIYFYERLFLLR